MAPSTVEQHFLLQRASLLRELTKLNHLIDEQNLLAYWQCGVAALQVHLPVDSIMSQIGSAIDIVIQLTRMRDGRRCVTQVTEFVGYDKREGVLRTKDIFFLDAESKHAKLMPTGALPTFMGELIDNDLIDLTAFYQ